MGSGEEVNHRLSQRGNAICRPPSVNALRQKAVSDGKCPFAERNRAALQAAGDGPLQAFQSPRRQPACLLCSLSMCG
eukprot:scaffold160322_cov39-Prasinocladus_malaysianus.AAC.1